MLTPASKDADNADKGFEIQAICPIVTAMNRIHSDHYVAPSGASIIKRLLNFLVALAVGFIALYLWLNNLIQDEQQLQRQANQLGYMISAQNARLLAGHLSTNELDAVKLQLHILEEDEHVHSVSLYRDNGELLLSSDEQSSLVTLFAPEQEPELLVYVQEIQQDDKILGFLRVLLWRDRVLQHYQAYQHEILFQAGMLMVLSLLVGVMATRGFYKWRYRDKPNVAR